MEKFMFIRYRHTFAWGNEKNWKYIEIPDEETIINTYGYDDISEYLSDELEITEEHDWSDAYRGFDWEPVEKFPQDVILKKIQNCQSNILYYTNKLKKLESML